MKTHLLIMIDGLSYGQDIQCCAYAHGVFHFDNNASLLHDWIGEPLAFNIQSGEISQWNWYYGAFSLDGRCIAMGSIETWNICRYEISRCEVWCPSLKVDLECVTLQWKKSFLVRAATTTSRWAVLITLGELCADDAGNLSHQHELFWGQKCSCWSARSCFWSWIEMYHMFLRFIADITMPPLDTW